MLSTSCPLITSHQIMRKDASKVWSRAPSGDESQVLAAAQLQPWKHHCQTTGSVQTCAFSWKNKTIVGLHCVNFCDGIHQDIDFPLCCFLNHAALVFLPPYPSFAALLLWFIAWSSWCSLTGVSLSTQVNTLRLRAAASGAIPRFLKVQSKCLNRKGTVTWMIHAH